MKHMSGIFDGKFAKKIPFPDISSDAGVKHHSFGDFGYDSDIRKEEFKEPPQAYSLFSSEELGYDSDVAEDELKDPQAYSLYSTRELGFPKPETLALQSFN